MKLVKTYWLLVLIFIIALFLRTYNLSEFPVGLHNDEASIGYNAYSLLKTAHDQNGNFLPLAIDQFGDQRPAGYHYIDIPFVALFGLNELAVRLPAAIYGSLLVLVLYFLVFELLENRLIALTSAFLLAILPWNINISRASSESVIASFFVLLGAYFFLKFIKNKTSSYLIIFLSFLSFFSQFLLLPCAKILPAAIFSIPCSILLLRLPSHWKKGNHINNYVWSAYCLCTFFLIPRKRGRSRISNKHL